MKNKKLFGALSLLFATGLILGACTAKKSSSNPSSSAQPSSSETPSSSSSSEVTKYTVNFVVNGTVVQTSQVEEGATAVYEGATPTKPGDAQVYKYGFRGWDKDITQPITADTTFTAVFAEYSEVNLVDNFEAYADAGEMHDDGKWVPLKYNNETSAWEEDKGGTNDVSYNAREGLKALRFQSWGNGVGYKFAKKLTAGDFTQASNALKFHLKTNKFNTVKVIVFTSPVTVSGEEVVPSATYTMDVQTSEYTEYTIPMSADWALWGDKAQYGTIASAASWTGIHQDDVVKMLTKIEFYVQGSDDAGGQQQFTHLDNLRFVTLDEPSEDQRQEMRDEKVYTGLAADGKTVIKIELGDEGAASAKLINLETPVTVPGTYEIHDKEITFTSADSGATLVYKGTLVDGGLSVKFKSATGTQAAFVGEMDLNAVQLVQDFEQYSSSGTAWHQGNTKDDRAGFRGDFYQEYYGGGSSPWAGSGWTLMGGGGEQANLKTDGGHTGTKYASFKSSKTYAMRYMQFGLFDGTADKQYYRGSTFSFWAKTTNTSAKIRVTVFNTPAPVLANEIDKTQCRRLDTIEVGSVGTWKHYEIALNPKLSYYGYSIMLDHNDIRDGALYVDDVEIYTANPYAAYEVPAQAGLPTGTLYTAKYASIYGVKFQTLTGNNVAISIPALGASDTGTYAMNGDEVTMTFASGDTFVGTVKDGGRTIQYKSTTGTGMVADVLKNNTLQMVEFADNAEYASAGKMYAQNCMDNTKIYGARGAWHCDYYSEGASKPSLLGDPNWSLMGGDANQLDLDTTTKVDGNSSLKMKFSTAGNMRYIQWDMFSGQARARKGYNRFVIYLKNPNAHEVKIKLFIFKVAKITVGNYASDDTKITKEITLAANADWAAYTQTLDPSKTYYGFGINMVTKDKTGFINVDTAFYDNSYESPDLYYYTIPGLPLSGKLAGDNAATLTFGANGTANFKCAALSVDANGTYVTYMNMDHQEIIFTFGDNVIRGSYEFNIMTLTFSFTVISATGDYAPYIPADSVFSYTIPAE